MANRLFNRAVLLAFIATLALRSQAKTAPTTAIDYDRDIRPILSENCFYCHGADASHRKAKMRLDTSEGAQAKALVPGKPEASEMIKRIYSTDKDEQMPPPGSNRHLTEEQKNTLKQWIASGAKYEIHWAFKAPVRPEVPRVKQSRWPHNPIDNFILWRLEQEKLKPSREASLDKLLRRVSLDLNGLPPTSEQISKWKRAKDPYSAAVDELLSSPHFGERMASDWMDVARYADTHGFNNDSLRSMWRWRDWVIDAYNQNMPYNRFITEQLAGDLLPNPTLDQLIATGFNRNHVINSEGGIIDEEYRVEYVADRVRTTSLAWLGLTMECCRCHDHKFDPMTQKDYYSMFAFFNSVDEFGEDGRTANASPFIVSPTSTQQKEMAQQRTAMTQAQQKLTSELASKTWDSVNWNDLVSTNNADLASGTNKMILFNVSSWPQTNHAISNLAGGKTFEIKGALTTTNGPSETKALVFDGKTSLKAAELPKNDSGKGWAFSAWIRPDKSSDCVLFSSMNFAVPPSSQQYGQGVEIRLTANGSIDVRAARRWPAYAIELVTREKTLPQKWQHILVTCDGSEWSKGIRIYLNGEECFRDALHDNFAITSIPGRADLGASAEKGAPHFVGAMADIKLLSAPLKNEQLIASAQNEVVQAAARQPDFVSENAIKTLHRTWLQKNDKEFAKAQESYNKSRAALLALEREAPTTMVMKEVAKPRETHILFRGQYDQPRDKVEPNVPEFLLPFPKNAPRNRLGLAQWFTDPRHPLTARVVVNRLWQNIFGTGIVKTSENFGFQADWPSHQELLDWLAVDFVESGWDMKRLIRLMVTSAAYRQDSRSTPELNERDPENRLLARGPRQRLTAEMIRDQALSLSGLLRDRIGGPPVFPYQPANYYSGVVVAAAYPGTSWTDSKGDDLYRRSLYTFWKRTVPQPTLATFDAPDREVCIARRTKTDTPLQALALMNDTIQIETARQLAERMLTEAGHDTKKRIDFAFKLATAREPKSSEEKALSALLQKRLTYYRSQPNAAKEFISVGESKVKSKLDPAELAAYANVASLILNLDETITRN